MELLLTVHCQQILADTVHPETILLVLPIASTLCICDLTCYSLRAMIDEIGRGGAIDDARDLQDTEVQDHPVVRAR